MVNKDNWQKRITFWLKEKQYTRLKQICNKNGLSMSDFLRLCVENAGLIINPRQMKVSPNVLNNLLASVKEMEKDIKSYRPAG